MEDDAIFHTGEQREDYYNAIAPPIIQSSNFAFDSIDQFRTAMSDEWKHSIYGRGCNPTVRIAEQKLADLEGTEAALLVGSGASAMSLAVMGQVGSGDHIICVENPYSWTYSLLVNYLSRFNIDHSFVGGNVDSIRSAIQSNTKVLVLESPNSLTFGIQDLRACADLADKFNITTIVDNSLATPIYQRPKEFGIDIVIHSVSKYLNGHSDVVAGVICSAKEKIERLFYNEYMTLGSTVSASDASLIIRGLRTLPLRMERVTDSAERIIEFMRNDPRFDRLYYPLLPESEHYSLAQKQMRRGAGLLTAEIKAISLEQMQAFANALKRFKIAVSWGGPESLILPMVALYGQRGRKDPEVSWKVCRFSIGLEDPELLIEDISQALRVAGF